MQRLGNALIIVSNMAKNIMMLEKRMLDVSSPVYVLGILHLSSSVT